MSSLDPKIAGVPTFQGAKIGTLQELQHRLSDFYIGAHQDRFWGNEKMHWAEQQYKRHLQFSVPLQHAMQLLFCEDQRWYRVGDLGDFLQFMRTRSHSDMVRGSNQTFANHVHRIHTQLWPAEKLSVDAFRTADSPRKKMAQRVSDTIGSLQEWYDSYTGKKPKPVVKENSLICQAHLNNVTVRSMRNSALQTKLSDVETPLPLAITATLDSTPATGDGPAPFAATLVGVPVEGAKMCAKRPALTMASSTAIVDSEPVPTGVPVARPELPKKKKQKVVKGLNPSSYAPPKESHKQLRFAGTCRPLIVYLKKNGVWDYAGEKHWKAIGKWMHTEEGKDWLRDAGLDPDGASRDHVQAKAEFRFDHAYNCVFMMTGVNAHFQDSSDEEKRVYVGLQAWNVSDAARKYAWNKMRNGVDMSAFDPLPAMMR